MIWHPLLLAVAVIDLVSGGLILRSGVTAFKVAVGWQPESSESAQLLLERDYETASIAARFGLWGFGISTVILITAVTTVLPGIVPGAMCGTGVLQATDGYGGRMIGFRLLTVFILYLWQVLDGFNRKHPEGPLTRTGARLLLIALPFLFFALFDTFRAMQGLDVSHPVDCCAVVYDRVAPAAFEIGRTAPALWLSLFVGLGGALCVLGLRQGLATRLPGMGGALLTALLSFCWVPVAGISLVKILSAYHFQVLFHHCPWCLFLPEHAGVGFVLFAALGLVAAEAAVGPVAVKVAATVPDLIPESLRRIRQAGLGICIGAAVFLLLSGIPAILWRFRFGVWIGG